MGLGQNYTRIWTAGLVFSKKPGQPRYQFLTHIHVRLRERFLLERQVADVSSQNPCARPSPGEGRGNGSSSLRIEPVSRKPRTLVGWELYSKRRLSSEWVRFSGFFFKPWPVLRPASSLSRGSSKPSFGLCEPQTIPNIQLHPIFPCKWLRKWTSVQKKNKVLFLFAQNKKDREI